MKIIFFGTPDFACPGLKALLAQPENKIVAVVTQPDRPAGRGGQISESPIKKIAVENNIPVLQPRSIRKECAEFLKALSQFEKPDIGVVIAFGQILPVEVLNYPKFGSINVHASILPRWRGAAPIQRALLDGDSETGVCLMRMEAGLDTGPVFSMAKTPITKDETHGTLHDKLAELGASLLSKDLKAIADGKIVAKTQDEVGVTYAKKVESAEAKIDWTKSVSEIERHVRAFSPFPGAFCSANGKRLKIFKAEIRSLLPKDAEIPNGAIVAVEKEFFDIRCVDGLLRPVELQIEGKKRTAVAEFLRGNQLQVKESLG